MAKPGIFEFFKKNGPDLCIGFGIVSMFAGTVSAAMATPKALKDIEKYKERRLKEDENYKFKPLDVFKAGAWKHYIATFALSVGGAISICQGVRGKNERYAELLTLYSMSEDTLKEYQQKVIEKFGEKKEAEIHEEMAQEKVNDTQLVYNDVIITRYGDSLFLDPISNKYFTYDIEKIRAAVNRLNQRLMVEMYISINDLYDELNLKCIDDIADVGWNIEQGLINIQFRYVAGPDDRPCAVLDYSMNKPRHDYTSLH